MAPRIATAALLLAVATLAAAEGASLLGPDSNCSGEKCCTGGTCTAECCELDGRTPCGGNSCTQGGCKKHGVTCAAKPPPPPPPPGFTPSGFAPWPDCAGGENFSCFSEVEPFIAAMNATATNGSLYCNEHQPFGGVTNNSLGCKLALICDASKPCHISSEHSMFPFMDPFCAPVRTPACTERYGSSIVVLRNMAVWMINVVVGPHTNTAWHGGMGGLLSVQNSAQFLGANVTWQVMLH